MQANKMRFSVSVLPWIICGLAAAFYCYEYLLRVTPGIMVPELQQAFSVGGQYLDATLIGHLSGFYYYAYTPMQLPVGLLMDRYGPRGILTMAVLCCALGTVVFGSTQSYWIAAAGRFFVGFGSAFAFVGVLKLASAWLPANRFAMVSGMTTTLGTLGAMIGGICLTELVQLIGWRETIQYSAYVGFALVPIVWLVVRDAPPPQLAELLHNTKTEVTVSSYQQLWREIYAAIKNPQIWVNGLIGGLLMMPTMVFPELWGKLYLQTVHNLDPRTASQTVSMIFLGWVIGGPLTGFCSDWMRRRKIPIMVGAILVTLLLWLFLFSPNMSVMQMKIILFLVGVTSSVEVICFAVGRENCPDNIAGTAVAVTNFIVVMFAAFQVIVAKILDYTWDGTIIDQTKIYSTDNYQVAMLVLPAATLVAFVLCFFLKETYCQSQVSIEKTG